MPTICVGDKRTVQLYGVAYLEIICAHVDRVWDCLLWYRDRKVSPQRLLIHEDSIGRLYTPEPPLTDSEEGYEGCYNPAYG